MVSHDVVLRYIFLKVIIFYNHVTGWKVFLVMETNLEPTLVTPPIYKYLAQYNTRLCKISNWHPFPFECYVFT